MNIWVPFPIVTAALGFGIGFFLSWLWLVFVSHCDMRRQPAWIPWTQPSCELCFKGGIEEGVRRQRAEQQKERAARVPIQFIRKSQEEQV